MITGLQLALAAGALVGLGVAFILFRLAPAQPDLADVLQRLSPEGTRRRARPVEELPVQSPLEQRIGVWGMKHLPPWLWGNTAKEDLAILRTTYATHYGRKIGFAVLGLLVGPLVGGIFLLFHIVLPVVFPTAASLALAGFGFVAPDMDASTTAQRARVEFKRTLAAYIELVAQERIMGSGPRTAMERAAEVGDSWVFRRIGEELSRSAWSGQTPWDALTHLSREVGVPELVDVADIMRLSDDEGAAVYDTLRARSAGLRDAILNADLATANEIGQRMTIPMSMLGIVFMVILVTPQILRMAGA